MGSKIIYYLIILPISRLPYVLIYTFSNFIFFVIYRILKYRNNVIEDNFRKSFPNKKNEEITFLKKQFYKHFGKI